jgi:hypothetical protein
MIAKRVSKPSALFSKDLAFLDQPRADAEGIEHHVSVETLAGGFSRGMLMISGKPPLFAEPSGLSMKSLILHLFSLCIVMSAIAHTGVEGAFTCPIDGKKFKQVVDASGTQFGARLDFKPPGPTAAPWIIPQCPNCKFVLCQESFDKATVQKLKPFILSDDYRVAAKGNPSYFCLALIRGFLGADNLKIGDAYLQASWQVESNPKKCDEYLRLAHG